MGETAEAARSIVVLACTVVEHHTLDFKRRAKVNLEPVAFLLRGMTKSSHVAVDSIGGGKLGFVLESTSLSCSLSGRNIDTTRDDLDFIELNGISRGGLNLDLRCVGGTSGRGRVGRGTG